MSMIDKMTLVCAAALALGACDVATETTALAAADAPAPDAEVSERGGDAASTHRGGPSGA